MIALLAAGCGVSTDPRPTSDVRRPIHVSIAPGRDIPLDLPAQSFRLVLEVRSGLQIQALPSNATSVEVTFTGDQLSSPYTQTVSSAQFINNTAQIIVSGLNAGTYKVTATVKDSGGATIVTGSMDVGILASQSTSANLVLIYGNPAATGTLDGKVDFNAPAVSITSIGMDPATLPGPGYPARITVTTDRTDQNGLTYHYTADGGSFSGSGPQVIWIAPQTQGGTYTITVKLEDGVHTPVTQSITATVPSASGTVTGNASFANFS